MYGCPSMTTTHKLDQCSPTSSSVVMTLMVLASRKTVGSHPGTTLSFAWATVASAINKANESIARLAIRQIFMFVRVVSMRLHLQSYSRPYTARDQIFPEPPAVEIAGRGLLNGVYTKEVLASPSWLRRSSISAQLPPARSHEASPRCGVVRTTGYIDGRLR